MNETEGAVGKQPAAPDLTVELRENPRSTLDCGCGSGRPAIWLIVARDGSRFGCCYSCVGQVWAEERMF